ncbi:hypothetical protein [Shewanella frigidimarina]|uniref:ORC-CDC6 family AAA ATPase n=1 Tax=Shewanella frigidimarina TaxID=56812 RepID=UPI003D7A86CE
MNSINELLLQISKRAERKSSDYLVKSFVHLGHVFTILKTEENQIIYGRRGTGKTHLLLFLKNSLEEKNEIVIQADMRCLGSTGGIYADTNIPLSERATRLLSDLLCEIHTSLIEKISGNDICDLSLAAPYLDNLLDLSTNISIDGTVAIERSDGESSENNQQLSGSISSVPLFNVKGSKQEKNSQIVSNKNTTSGKEKLKLHFGAISKSIKNIIQLLPSNKLWILLDEWSEVPQDLQPFLAESIKKILFSIPTLTIKIASIEHRSRFRMVNDNESIGLELSADASTSINLDEFMVFDTDKTKSIEFFKELIHKHCLALDESNYCPVESNKFIKQIFTSNSVFEEFVRASEGIPRDAIHIISEAAMHSGRNRLSISSIRTAARKWYTTNKSKDINFCEEAIHLLDWIINKVIAEKSTRGFLVRADVKEDLIEFLYDSRIIHLVKQGVTAKNQKGKRFNLYVLDYGCYADLLSTKDEPKGMIYEEGEYIEIPLIDYRSLNSSILDINEYKKTGHLPLVQSTDDIYLQTKHNGIRKNPDNEIDISFLDNIGVDFNKLKVKETVYIPIIFVGLILRLKLGHTQSSGSEITHVFNHYVAGIDSHKKSNNISRALRDNEIVKSESWLKIHELKNGNRFSLSTGWEKCWDEYFNTYRLIE